MVVKSSAYNIMLMVVGGGDIMHVYINECGGRGSFRESVEMWGGYNASIY